MLRILVLPDGVRVSPHEHVPTLLVSDGTLSRGDLFCLRDVMELLDRVVLLVHLEKHSTAVSKRVEWSSAFRETAKMETHTDRKRDVRLGVLVAHIRHRFVG